MRILKKLVRKLYHLIWFLSIFFLFSPIVKAVNGEIPASIRSSEITQSSQAQCYNNSHNSINTSFISNVGYATYYQCNLSSTNGYLSFNVNHALVTDTLYQITLYIGNQGNQPMGHSSTNISTGTGVTDANNNNNQGLQRASVWNFADTWNIDTLIDASNGEITVQPSSSIVHLYFITFTVSSDGKAFINVPIQFGSSTGNVYYYGYNLQVIGRLSNNLTSSDVQSVINNSGLATARSVQDVQSSVNQVRQELSDLEQSERQNAEDIIDNQNSNTDKEIQSQKVCKAKTYSYSSAPNKEVFLTSNGSLYSSTYYNVTDYIAIDNDSRIDVLQGQSSSSAYYCLYDNNKSVISCSSQGNLPTGSTITIPTNARFLRYSIHNSNTPIVSVSTCVNGNQALDDSINGLNDSITDSNVDSSDDTINNLKNRIPTNSVISDLLLLPVRFLQNFVNALGSSCNQFNLGSLYGTNLYMPCINIENYLGSAIWTTIDLIISGLFVYSLRKKFIQIYQNLTNLKNGGNEVD